MNGSLDGGTTEHNKKKQNYIYMDILLFFFKKQEALPPYWWILQWNLVYVMHYYIHESFECFLLISELVFLLDDHTEWSQT